MTDYQDDLLGGAFAGFRGEVAPQVVPAGTAAAYATVRHRRRVRAVTVTAAAVLLAAAPVAAYATIGGGPGGSPVEPGESASPTVAEPSPPLETPEAAAIPHVPGKVFYLDGSGALYVDGQQYPGGPYLSLNVMPDGERVTWVDDAGDLIASDLDGSNQELVFPDADGECVEPVWSHNGDHRHLLVHDADNAVRPGVWVMHEIGTGVPIGEPLGCHYRWSADGEWIAVLHDDMSAVTVMDIGGENRRPVSLALDGRLATDLVSVSVEAGRICARTVAAGEPVGDVARSLACDTIIDLATGTEIELPVDGELVAALFQPDGGVLARVRTDAGTELVLLDGGGEVVARTVEPSATADLLLLAYVR